MSESDLTRRTAKETPAEPVPSASPWAPPEEPEPTPPQQAPLFDAVAEPAPAVVTPTTTEPEPAKPEHAPAAAWTQVDEPEPARPTPAQPVESPEATFEKLARQAGDPRWAAFGWTVFLIGLVVVTYGYYTLKVQNLNRLGDMAHVAGVIRMDVFGIFFAWVGLNLAIIFTFLPKKRAFGPQLTQSDQRWLAYERTLKGRNTSFRALTIYGWILVVIGTLGAAWGLFFSWSQSTATEPFDVTITIFNLQVPIWTMGVAIAVVGFLVFAFTYPRIRGVAGTRQALLLAVMSRRGEAANLEALDGVTPEQVRAMLRRLDALLSALPEEQISQFANTPEAEAYLKLLG